jgi:hypothetical protein
MAQDHWLKVLNRSYSQRRGAPNGFRARREARGRPRRPLACANIDYETTGPEMAAWQAF